MARTPNTRKKVQFTSALIPRQMAQITALAEEYGTSQARVIRELIQVGLKAVEQGYLFTITEEQD